MAKTVLKTAKRSMIDDRRAEPKAIAWAWERNIKIGTGRKPDIHLFTEDQIKMYDPQDFIIVRANSAWVGSTGVATGPRR